MNLNRLGRMELDQKIKSLASQERELLHDILLVIKEIDARRLYLDMGFGSLFSYLVEGVGYSEGAAQRRIDAARLLKEVPSLAEKIQSGSVSLSQISLMQKSLREAKRKSNTISTQDKFKLIDKINNKTYQQTQKEIAVFLDLPILKSETKTTQADESVYMTLSLSKELYQKISQAQELLSHSLPDKDLVSYLEFVTNKVLKQKNRPDHKLQAETDHKQKDRLNPTQIAKTNHKNTNTTDHRQKVEVDHKNVVETNLSSSTYDNLNTKSTADVAVTREVYKENHGGKFLSKNRAIPQNKKFNFHVNAGRKSLINPTASCQFKDPVTGKVCGSRWHLQTDHKHSRGAGGPNKAENYQILCRPHNIFKYKKEMGITYKS